MPTTCGETLKNARNNRNMDVKNAACKLNISDRKLYNIESDELKNKDGDLYVDFMKLYKDIKVGVNYLSDDPVVKYIFGDINFTNPLKAAATFAAEIDDDTNIIPVLLKWAISDGNEPLLDKIQRRIKSTMDALIDLYLNIMQKQGFAY